MQTVVDFVFNFHFLVGGLVGYFVVPYLVTDWSGEVSTTEKGVVKWITFDEFYDIMTKKSFA